MLLFCPLRSHVLGQETSVLTLCEACCENLAIKTQCNSDAHTRTSMIGRRQMQLKREHWSSWTCGFVDRDNRALSSYRTTRARKKPGGVAQPRHHLAIVQVSAQRCNNAQHVEEEVLPVEAVASTGRAQLNRRPHPLGLQLHNALFAGVVCTYSMAGLSNSCQMARAMCTTACV
eukprot:535265-Pelagomonas_calceolata.AAC.4